MAIVSTDSQNYTDIANSIRSINGSTDSYRPDEMADAIAAIGSPDINLAEYDTKEYVDEQVQDKATTEYVDTSIANINASLDWNDTTQISNHPGMRRVSAALKEYSQTINSELGSIVSFCGFSITEVDGFDNLISDSMIIPSANIVEAVGEYFEIRFASGERYRMEVAEANNTQVTGLFYPSDHNGEAGSFTLSINSDTDGILALYYTVESYTKRPDPNNTGSITQTSNYVRPFFWESSDTQTIIPANPDLLGGEGTTGQHLVRTNGSVEWQNLDAASADHTHGSIEDWSTIRQINNFSLSTVISSSPTTLAYTGLSWTAPYDCFVVAIGSAIYSKSQAQQVSIGTSSTTVHSMFAANDHTVSSSPCCTGFIDLAAGETIYLWGKWAAAGANNAVLKGIYIKK